MADATSIAQTWTGLMNRPAELKNSETEDFGPQQTAGNTLPMTLMAPDEILMPDEVI